MWVAAIFFFEYLMWVAQLFETVGAKAIVVFISYQIVGCVAQLNSTAVATGYMARFTFKWLVAAGAAL